MKTIKIPYYTSNLDLDIDENNLKALLYSSHDVHTDKTEGELVQTALENPIGSTRLSEIVKGKKNMVIVTSDHTRAVPSKLTLPLLLLEIRKGNPTIDVTILVATGLHRPTTIEEQRKMFGDNIVDNEKIVVHDAFDDSSVEYVCSLPSGADCVVNKLAIHTDLLITEGFIEPHFFAGFSGGRKSILPGICSAVTVNENHSSKAIANPNSKGGILDGNVIHEDMVAAARAVNVQFTLNVALDGDKKVIGAWAGELVESHAVGVDFVKGLSKVPAVMGDIVITSNGGYPLDQNLYQSPKAASTAAACAKEGGVVIMVASCCDGDGLGGSHFGEIMQCGTPKEIMDKLLAIPPKETIPEQWSAQIFADILMHSQVILVSTFMDPELIKKVNMIPAKTPNEALEIAYSIKGKDAEVVVIPDGVSVIAVKEA